MEWTKTLVSPYHTIPLINYKSTHQLTIKANKHINTHRYSTHHHTSKMKLYLVSSALALITNAASISGQQFPNEGRQYADYGRQMGEQYSDYGRAVGEHYAPEYEYDDGYNYNNMGGYEGRYRNYMGAKSSKGPPGRAYGAKSFKGSGRAYYGAKAFKEDGPYYYYASG